MKIFKIIYISLGLILSMETLANPIFSNNLLIKAQSGGSLAQLELADVYVHGYGVDQDEAERWAIRSA